MSSEPTLRTLPCTECDLKFSTERILRAHKQLSHTVDLQCADCLRVFDLKPEFLKHMIFGHSPTTEALSCSECSLAFSTQKEFQSHYKGAHSVQFSCTKCTARFSTNNARQRHKEEAHPTPQKFPCSVCLALTSNSKHLKRHLLLTHRGSCFCQICMHTSRNHITLANHKKEMHPECEQCNARCDKANLQDHYRVTGHLYCDECNICFQTVKAHTVHVRTIEHTTQCRCCDCDREYPNQDALNNHCCDCDIVNPTYKGLEKHLASPAHASKIDELEAKGLKGLKDFKGLRCGKCNHATASEKSLAQHNREFHKTIPCPAGGRCLKKFASPSALISHLESGRCSSGMTRVKLAEAVFAHDTNRYITSIDANSAVEGSTRLKGTTNPKLKTPIEANQASSLPIVETNGSPRYDHQFAARKLQPTIHDNAVVGETRDGNDDDDTASEWSQVGGAPLTPTSNDEEDNWSFIFREKLTPAASDAMSERPTSSGVLINTPTNSAPTSRRASLSSLSFPISSTSFCCNLCPPDRKPFSNHLALQMHIDSPAHSPAIFHCPISFLPNMKPEDLLKRRNFKTLGGLTQHLERGACSGGLELYKMAMEFVQEKLEGLGIKGIQLLKV